MRFVRTSVPMVMLAGLLCVACAPRSSPPPSPATFALTPFPMLSPVPTQSIGFPTATIAQTQSPVISSTPSATPVVHRFDDVADRELLSALFPDLTFTPTTDAFRVNNDAQWSMWVNSAVEGRFTQASEPELAAIIANDAPQISADQAKRYAPWGSFLAIFQRRAGKLQLVQRAFLFPTQLSPQAFSVEIGAAPDFDHNGQDELLISTTSERLGISTTSAFLYQWDGQTFTSIWSATIAEDNTSALNQSDYYSIEARMEFADLDHNGYDEIIVDSTRTDFARDAQGLADTTRPVAVKTIRQVHRWNGTAFVIDPARSTPLPK